MPPLTPCTYLQIFILFCYVCVCCVLFCFFSFPLWVPESVLHSLNAIGLTLQMKHFLTPAKKYDLTETLTYTRFQILLTRVLSCLQLFITRGVHGPEGWGKNCGL